MLVFSQFLKHIVFSLAVKSPWPKHSFFFLLPLAAATDTGLRLEDKLHLFYLSQNPESLGFVSPIAPPAQDLLFTACISLQGELAGCSSISSTGLWAPWGHIYLAIPCAEDRVCSLGSVQQLFVEWINKWFRGGVNPEADSPVKIVAEVKYCRPLHGGLGVGAA